jgi:hypothetical protein
MSDTSSTDKAQDPYEDGSVPADADLSPEGVEVEEAPTVDDEKKES